MSDTATTEALDERELHDPTTDPTTAEQPVTTATDQAAPFRLDDYATAGAEAPKPNAAPAASSIEPYTDEEIATLGATFSGYGLPLEALDDYSRAFVARALPVLTILQAGEAFAELGIHKGAGFGQAPAWVRAAAAGAGLAVVTIMTRRQFAGGGERESHDWTTDLSSGAAAGESASDAGVS